MNICKYSNLINTEGMEIVSSDDSSGISQLKKYAEDISTLYKAEKAKSKKLEDANRQLMEYADALNRTISEVRSKNEKFGALALELSSVEEHERSIIAEDLHDHIGQTLAMAKVKLQELSKSFGNAGRLDEIDGLIQQAILYSRSMMFEISPTALLELGFVEAIEWLVEHIQSKHGLDIKYSHCEQANPIDNNTGIIFFKAVRELLMNVVKHARTDNASVSVENDGCGIRVIVLDDGAGFNPSKMNQKTPDKMRFGLFNMQQRIISAGGSIDIVSSPGNGARAVITTKKKDK